VARIYIAIGSNISPQAHVRAAISLLNSKITITAISTFYETPAEGNPEQANFYNGVIAAKTNLAPLDLKLVILREIEQQLGRIRTNDKNAPRTIDLDLLLYDELIVNSSELILPDPDIQQRAFLAIPLCELDRDLVLPGSGQRIRDIAAQLKSHTMKPLLDYTRQLKELIEHES
jgi:2-amino-4-hydroxy-6-hydroxymethyldihydropteridine diphosphokinase